MKLYRLLLIIFVFATVENHAQFTIKVPKINKPTKIENTQNTNSPVSSIKGRQMVMDDAVTFFDAEPVKEYDEKIRLQKDIGWYLKSTLRILGTFPKRSAFRVAVKKNGKELASNRCEGIVYTKSDDIYLRSPQSRAKRDLNFEDFMSSGARCFDEKAVIKETGELDVEIYFIDGESDAEKLVRKHKIDVHRAAKVRGNASNPQPDVADYYIQRHAESAVAVAYFIAINSDGGAYFSKPAETFGSESYGRLFVYTSYSPDEQTKLPVNPFVRCTVNGQKLNLPDDRMRVFEDQGRREIGIYTDRIAAKYKTGPPYKDWVEFVGLNFQFPIYTGKTAFPNQTRIEDNAGKWECSVIENGVTYRTFRWEFAGGEIVPHGEQQKGNINLFYKAALIDMEIPSGGSPIDHRLIPMPNNGLFYGISWATAEGKAMAARVPKKGNPFHVASNKVQ